MREWKKDEEALNYVGLYVPVILGEAAARLGEDGRREEIVGFLLEALGEAEDDNDEYLAEACAYACGRQGVWIVPRVIERIEGGGEGAKWLWSFLGSARRNEECEGRVKELGKRAVEEALEGKRAVEDLWPALGALTDFPNPAAEEALKRLGEEKRGELKGADLWPEYRAALQAACGERREDPPGEGWRMDPREFLTEELEAWKEAYAYGEEGEGYEEEGIDPGEAADERSEKLAARFGESEEARGLSEAAREEAVAQARMMIEYGMMYVDDRVEAWGIGDWQEVLLEVFPRKISAEPEWFGTVAEIAAALLRWLAREGLAPNGETLAAEVAGWGPRIEAAAADPANWGMAKSMVMGAHGAGIDVTDPAGLDAYVRQYNERLDEETGEEEDVFDPYERQEPIVRETPKIGRNDPCPCGSGKKYKKCCGK
jgi:hypothetical protein